MPGRSLLICTVGLGRADLLHLLCPGLLEATTTGCSPGPGELPELPNDGTWDCSVLCKALSLPK